MPQRRVRVFVSYAHEDGDHLDAFQRHTAGLARDLAEFYCDREIQPGQGWKQRVLDELASADVVVLLLTVNFINSAFCMNDELPRARGRHETGACELIPLNVAPFDPPTTAGLREMQWTPSGAPITSRGGETEQAWADAAKAVRNAAERRQSGGAAQVPSSTDTQTLSDEPLPANSQDLGFEDVAKPPDPLPKRFAKATVDRFAGPMRIRWAAERLANVFKIASDDQQSLDRAAREYGRSMRLALRVDTSTALHFLTNTTIGFRAIAMGWLSPGRTRTG